MIVVIDDERTLDDSTAVHLRTSDDALDFFDRVDTLERNFHIELRIHQLWLDHDLGGDDTIRPVVDMLEWQASVGVVYNIGTVYVHTMNPVGAEMITRSRLLNENYLMIRTDLSKFLPQ